MENFQIIQLNCRSISNKLGDIKLMVYTQKPHVVVLSETWLSKYFPRFINYTCDWENRSGFAGGLGFLIRNDVHYSKITLKKHPQWYLEYQAVKVCIKNNYELCILQVYNPGKPVSVDELKFYIKQLGGRYMLVGDFNAHSKVLCTKCVKANPAGNSIERLITSENICLINPINFYTYVNARTGKRSCLDLCFASSNVAAEAEISALGDVGSDHIPVKTVLNIVPNVSAKLYTKKWKTNVVNLAEFTARVEVDDCGIRSPNNIDELAEGFANCVFKAATDTVERSSGKPSHRKRTVWWSQECSRAVAERRRARRKLEKYPSDENIKNYKMKTAAAKNICKKHKQRYFQNFIESIQYDTPMGVVWKKIKALKTGRDTTCMSLELNGVPVNDSIEKANRFARYIQGVAAVGNIGPKDNFIVKYSDACKQHKSEAYNQEITIGELLYAIQRSKDGSPGIDCISNLFLKNLPLNRLKELQNIINQSFITGIVPKCWKMGMVIPILKPGKPKGNINSYRPISLLSCVGKAAERVIQNRLQYLVDQRRLLDRSQFGYCRGDSTIDVHIRIEHIIRKCLSSKETCLVIYLDLSSAFDVVWPEGLIMKLINKGIKGNILAWLYNYLKGRCIKAKVDGYFSDEVEILAGTPQGAVLSPLLFNLMISDMPNDCLVRKHSYADDITLTCAGTDVAQITKALQAYMKKFMKWAKEWGIQINFGKTVMQYFTRRKIKCPIIRINNQVIRYERVHKLLGLYYDAPLLSWKFYIEHLQADCMKRLDLMKVMSSVNFGASSRVLRTFYISYIRAKIDYGSILYSTSAKTNLNKLDVIQNACSRLILGARKSTPVISLQAESCLPSLDLHRGKLCVKTLIKLCCKAPENDMIEWCSIDRVVKNKDESWCHVNSFMRRALQWCKTLNMQVQRQATKVATIIPPWQNGLQIVTSYNEEKIFDNTTFIDYLTTEYTGYSSCYTDGSKTDDHLKRVGCGVYFPVLELGLTYRLNPDHSVIYSELYAIRQALFFIKEYTVENYIVLSDSLSALHLINTNQKTYVDLVDEIKILLYDLNIYRVVIVHWVRGHVEIRGNEVADKLAKKVAENDRSVIAKLTREEMYSILNRQFQVYWDESYKFAVNTSGKGIHLYNIRENTTQSIPVYKLKCRTD